MPENRGYYDKFTVIDNRTGERVTEPTFTLKVESDPFAILALWAYRDAAAAVGGYDRLVDGLDQLLGDR